MEVKFFELSEGDIKDHYDEKGNWISYPDFHKVIWPFIIENKAEISKIFLLSNVRSKVSRKDFDNYLVENQKAPDSFIEIGGLNILDDSIINRLRDMCYLEGHFNVFFYSNDRDFIKRLCGIFPWPGYIFTDHLALSEEDLAHLNNFVKKLEPNDFLFSFCAEADFLAIFAVDDTLDELGKL